MHSVDAEIHKITADIDLDLSRVNKFTITNIGAANVDFGFADTFLQIATGQSTSFESGANSWFKDGLKLKLRFKGSANQSTQCNIAICRVVKPSNIFADALK